LKPDSVRAATSPSPEQKPQISAAVPQPGLKKSAPTPTLESSAKPEGSAPPTDSAAVEDPAPTGELPPLPPGDGKDGSELLSYQGYLIVRSPLDAEVFVQGISLGRTNTKLLSRCQQRNVRLRDTASARWATKGQSVRITCMATTTVTVHPD
jgi:hypothetical protein